jgi:hypothetical protein
MKKTASIGDSQQVWECSIAPSLEGIGVRAGDYREREIPWLGYVCFFLDGLRERDVLSC